MVFLDPGYFAHSNGASSAGGILSRFCNNRYLHFVSHLNSILAGIYLGPSFAMTQGLVQLRMRAVAAAILLFVLNLIGMGLGPYFVGIGSDLLMPAYGEESIRYALCISVALNGWSAIHFLIGARTLRQDLTDTEATLQEAASGGT